MEKTEARSEVKRRIDALSPGQRIEKSRRIATQLLRTPEFTAARVVMLFASMPDEADTRPIIDASLAAGKTVLLPRVDPKTRQMAACPIKDVATDTAPSTYGILEPVGSICVAAAAIDFCLVPARAFDRSGGRLGRGAGYYDRFMADHAFRAFRCGIAFQEQIIDAVPHEAHDLPVQMIVTDSEIIRPPAT